MLNLKLISFEITPGKTTDSAAELKGLVDLYKSGRPISVDKWLAKGLPVGKRLLERRGLEECWLLIRGGRQTAKSELSSFVTNSVSGQKIKGFEIIGKIDASNGGHQTAVTEVAISPDNKQLFSGGKDGTIKITDVEQFLKAKALKDKEGMKAATITIEPEISGHKGEIGELVISPNGKCLYSRSFQEEDDLISGEKIQIIDLATYQGAATTEGKKAAIKTIPNVRDLKYYERGKTIVSSPDGKYIYLNSGPGVIRIEIEALFKAKTEKGRKNAIRTIVKGESRGEEGLEVSPNSKYLLWETPGRGEVKMASLKEFLAAKTKEKREKTIKTLALKWGTADIASFKLSPDGKYLCVTEKTKRMFQGDRLIMVGVEAFLRAQALREDSKEIKTFNNVSSYRFSLDGKYLCLDQEGEISIIDVEAFLKTEEGKGKRAAFKRFRIKDKGEKCSSYGFFAYSQDSKYVFYKGTLSKGDKHKNILSVIELEKIMKATTAEEKSSAIKNVKSGFEEEFIVGESSLDSKYLLLASDRQINILRIIREE